MNPPVILSRLSNRVFICRLGKIILIGITPKLKNFKKLKFSAKQCLRTVLLVFFIFKLNFNLFSQQNFINVPSSEVTKRYKLFFQQQLNFSNYVQSGTTIDFGLGKGFEAGMNLFNVNFGSKNTNIHYDTTDKYTYNSLIMINGLKGIEISKKTSIVIGSQIGANSAYHKKNSLAAVAYLNLKLKDLVIKHSNIVGGVFFNCIDYANKKEVFGSWIGMEIPICKKLNFVGESIIGSRTISYSSVGIVFYPTKHLPLTFGVQIPNTKNNSYSFVFELTFIQ